MNYRKYAQWYDHALFRHRGKHSCRCPGNAELTRLLRNRNMSGMLPFFKVNTICSVDLEVARCGC